MMDFFQWLYWWCVKCVLGMLFVVALTRELGGSIWLALSIGSALAFLMAVGHTDSNGDDDDGDEQDDPPGLAGRISCEGRSAREH